MAAGGAAAAATGGTVTALGSLYPADEAQKASRHVQDAIAARAAELHRLGGFAADNAALAALVRRLPDELSHDIMVPFGSAAFFPGRLIHTNEFLVLLGEGYYAERTAKQTVEILQRRGKSLEAQMDSLKATLQDLEVEARFFDSTAAEAAEGIVEIREDYVEEPRQDAGSGVPDLDSHYDSKEDQSRILDEDEEYARIMARLDELEKEELEAGSGSDNDESEDTKASSGLSATQNDFDDHPSGIPQFVEPSMQSVRKDVSKSIAEKPVTTIRPELSPQPEEIPHEVQKLEDSFGITEKQIPKMGSGGPKAFTGSIIERNQDILPNKSTTSSTSDKPSGSNPSKPVSRFKMQKGNR